MADQVVDYLNIDWPEKATIPKIATNAATAAPTNILGFIKLIF